MLNRKRWIFRRAAIALFLIVFLTALSLLAALPTLSLRVTDANGQPVSGLSLKLRDSSPGVTNEVGEVQLELGSKLKPGVRGTLFLGEQERRASERWFLLSPWEGEEFQIPTPDAGPLSVRVARQGAKELLSNDQALKIIAETGVDRIQGLLRPGESYEGLRLQVIRDLADQAGLESAEVEQALRAWGERTPDPLDEGMAALASGQYVEAELKARQVQQGDKRRLARSSQLLGQALYAQGKYREAVDEYQTAVALDREDLELVNSLAIAHLYAGNYKEAELIFRQVTQGLQKTALRPLDWDITDILSALSNLALTLLAQGHLMEARQLQEQELDKCQQFLGSEHPYTLTSMNNLAETLRSIGEIEEARDIQEYVLQVSKRVLGINHPDTLRAMSNLGSTLYAQGDFVNARHFQVQALEARQVVLGANHPEVLKSINNLALTLQAQGSLREAQQLQEKVLEMSQYILGAEHPESLKAMGNLAETLRAQDELGHARRLQEKVLEISSRVLGPKHPDTLKSVNNLAITLLKEGDDAEARRLGEEAVKISRHTLGIEHPDTLRYMNNLSEILRFQGDIDGTRRLQEKTLGLSKHALGLEHPDTLRSLVNLASTLRALGDLGEARQLQEQAFEIMKSALGAEHPLTLTSMNNLASTLRSQGDLVGARGLQERALEVRRRVLGMEHSDTAISEWNLLLTVFEQGDVDTSIALIESLSRLLNQDPEQLSADEREIQESLTQFLQDIEEAASPSVTTESESTPP